MLSSHQTDWAKVINSISLAGETISSTSAGGAGAAAAAATAATTITAATTTQMPNLVIELNNAAARAAETESEMGLPMGLGTGTGARTTTTTSTSSETLALISDYAGFADIYLNTFYCLAIICLVSVFDR